MKNSFSRSLKETNIDLWNKILNHPFIKELGEFKLPKEKFKIFVEQDYQYLLGFIRCLGLFLSKSKQKKDIMEFRNLVEINVNEIESLEEIYDKLGYRKADLKSKEASLATISYRSFLLSQGQEGSKFETYGAILPCDWIFAEIGKKLKKDMPKESKYSHKIYQDWIESYASPEYQKDIKELRQKVDKKSEKASEREKRTFKENFKTALKYESSFFSYAYNQNNF